MNYKNSIQLTKQNHTLMPGGNTFNKTTFFDQGTTPFALTKGSGATVWDVDGNKYTDFINGIGCISLGYCFEEIDKAITERLEQGITLPLSNPLELEVAQKLVEMIPCAEMVRYGKNGSDVLSAAVRLARHITQRDHVVFGGYHGWHDWCIAKTSRPGGIPEAIRALSHKFVFNDIDSLYRLIKELNGEVSCVVMDIVARYYPEPGFLEEVRELTAKNGIILIFDEVITGFRMDKGGAQAYFKVTPDLACFGKALANGMPISVVVGKSEYMSRFEEIFYALNYASETLSLAAANATLDFYNKVDLPKVLYENGMILRKGLQNTLKRHGLDHIFDIQGMPCRNILGLGKSVDSDFLLKKGAEIERLFPCIFELFAEKGILTNLSLFLSYSHTLEDINYFLKCFDEICVTVREKFQL